MATPRRKVTSKEARLTKLSENILKHPNWTQQQHADELGIGRSSISKYIKNLKNQWAVSKTENVETHVDNELYKLELREQTALEWLEHFGFKDSDEGWTIQDDRYNSKEAVKWMDILLKIADRKAKLLGLDKPQKLEVDEHAQVIFYFPEPDEEQE
jgi:predicted transcriptional regulator